MKNNISFLKSFRLSQNLRDSIENYIDFTNSISKLNKVVGYRIEKNKEIEKLVVWYRGEVVKRIDPLETEKVVYDMLADEVLQGFDIRKSIDNVYLKLKIEFMEIDLRRSLGI